MNDLKSVVLKAGVGAVDLMFLDRLRSTQHDLINEAVLRNAPIHDAHTMKLDEFFAPVVLNNREKYQRKYHKVKAGFTLPNNLREEKGFHPPIGLVVEELLTSLYVRDSEYFNKLFTTFMIMDKLTKNCSQNMIRLSCVWYLIQTRCEDEAGFLLPQIVLQTKQKLWLFFHSTGRTMAQIVHE